MSKFHKLLTETNWPSFAVSSYNTPESVPTALQAIVSTDATASGKGASTVEDAVVRQSGLHEAAYFAVAPLIAILEENLTPHRIKVYDLLFEIANGYGDPGEVLVTREGDTLSFRAACRREVRKGMSLYEQDAKSDDTAIRTTIRDMLEILAEPD